MQADLTTAYKKIHAYAAQAERDARFRWWDNNYPNNGTSQREPRLRPTQGGGMLNGQVNENVFMTFWQMAQQLNNLYLFWKQTGSEPIRQRIRDEWAYLKTAYTFAQLAGDGTDGSVGISDDACWKACTLMQIHEATGDGMALACLGEMIAATTDRFKDTTHTTTVMNMTPGIPGVVTARAFIKSQYGMLYARQDDAAAINRYGLISTSFEAVLAICALYVYENTGYGYLEYAEHTYTWLKTYMRTPATSDTSKSIGGLYYVDLDLTAIPPVPKNAFYGKPVRGTDATSIGGAFAMGVLAARLYRIKNDATLQADVNAIATAITSARAYARTVGGKLLLQSTRDPWTDGFFAPVFAAEALTLAGVDTSNVCRNALINTGIYIAENQREASYYRGDWAGPEANTLPGHPTPDNKWEDYWAADKASNPAAKEQVMTSSSATSMIQAGWIVAKNNPSLAI